ncbi:MAG: alpha/beta hydrolase [Caldimonas sp.]
MKTTDLRGATRLAIEAAAGLTDLVEAMHERIARVPGLGVPDGRTTGITGLVYKTVRGVTRLVGGSVDALLGVLTTSITQSSASAEREAVVAALNGVLGDHLAATGNPLSITMSLRHVGRVVVLERAALQLRFPAAGPTLVVALHGLCMNDLQWRREGQDQAAALAQAMGGTAIYLHYNTGLPVADNGHRFAVLMATLLREWPARPARVLLLAHSMGGLVARSALHQAAGQAWTQQVSDLVCLGTPHLGAPLERAGHGLEMLLDAVPYAAPLARLGRVRSAGIADLRHGHCGVGDDPVPLPARTRCWAVAAVLDGQAKGRLLGDGLVPRDSALGRHRNPARRLAFRQDRQCVSVGLNHLQLLSSRAVQTQLREWLISTPALS